MFMYTRFNKESEKLHIYLGQVLPLSYKKTFSFQDFLHLNMVDKGLWICIWYPPNIFDHRIPFFRSLQ